MRSAESRPASAVITPARPARAARPRYSAPPDLWRINFTEQRDHARLERLRLAGRQRQAADICHQRRLAPEQLAGLPALVAQPQVAPGLVIWLMYGPPCRTFIASTTTSAVIRPPCTPRPGLHSPHRRTLATPIEVKPGALPLILRPKERSRRLLLKLQDVRYQAGNPLGYPDSRGMPAPLLLPHGVPAPT